MQPSPDASDDTNRMFEAWEKEEGKTDISDISPEDWITFGLFWLLFGTVFLQFYTRYVLNNSLAWTEEVARYLLIGVCFFGSVMAMRKGTHIAVEAGLIYVPPRVRHWVLVAVDLIVAVFMAAMCFNAFELANINHGFMASMDVPKALLYWVACVAFGGIGIYAAVRFIRRLRGTQDDSLHQLKID